MSKTYFVVSDIHGFYDLFQKALTDAGFDKLNENHILIVCGDIFDRGNKPKEILEFLQSLNDRFIFIKGNHESLLKDCVAQMISGYLPDLHHYSNGTVKTVLRFCGLTENKFNMAVYDFSSPVFRKIEKVMFPILDWIDQKSVDYLELGNYIFVHGWIPVCPDWRNASRTKWEKARWTNGSLAWHNGNKEDGKTIVCGHWHTFEPNYLYHNEGSIKDLSKAVFTPFIDNGIVCLDACTALSKKVNVLVLNEADLNL